MELWNVFLEDYADEVFDWSLRSMLEIFWHYCQDGSRAVHKFLSEQGNSADITRCTCWDKGKTPSKIHEDGCPVLSH